jgi:hypothetical protein
MEMISIATGFGSHVSCDQLTEVCKWLTETYGVESKTTWYQFVDYDLAELVMNEEIYIMYKLKWK